jgi:hypothetical protein
VVKAIIIAENNRLLKIPAQFVNKERKSQYFAISVSITFAALVP